MLKDDPMKGRERSQASWCRWFGTAFSLLCCYSNSCLTIWGFRGSHLYRESRQEVLRASVLDWHRWDWPIGFHINVAIALSSAHNSSVRAGWSCILAYLDKLLAASVLPVSSRTRGHSVHNRRWTRSWSTFQNPLWQLSRNLSNSRPKNLESCIQRETATADWAWWMLGRVFLLVDCICRSMLSIFAIGLEQRHPLWWSLNF